MNLQTTSQRCCTMTLLYFQVYSLKTGMKGVMAFGQNFHIFQHHCHHHYLLKVYFQDLPWVVLSCLKQSKKLLVGLFRVIFHSKPHGSTRNHFMETYLTALQVNGNLCFQPFWPNSRSHANLVDSSFLLEPSTPMYFVK